MPERFVRIRKFGIYNHTTKRKLDLRFFTDAQQATQKIEKKTESRMERIRKLTGIDGCKCPSCKTGTLFITRNIPRIRSPAGNLPDILLSKLL
jgi:hypothetical protein